MIPTYRIYLDACCLNRPFDNQRQFRIALETQAILSILSRCQSGQWQLMASTALDTELDQTPDRERLSNIKAMLTVAKIKVLGSQELEVRARELKTLGFSSYDAVHIASAERGRADVFLSTDDRLIKRAAKITQLLRVPVDNPVPWLIQATQIEGNGDD
jgi:predicted nucleic acid-binding protein